MSIFSELIPKIFEISNAYTRNFNDDIQASLDILDKFAEEFHNGRSNPQEQSQRVKNPLTTLQSINEDEDESNKSPANEPDRKSLESTHSSKSSSESNENRPVKPKKRSKDEVDGHFSPDLDKRQKRSASVRAQSIISKQVNVNLTQKLRRERSMDKFQGTQSRVCKEDDKENAEPVIQIKQEKLSLPAEPMELEASPPRPPRPPPAEAVQVKREPDTDGLAMPPPAAPLLLPKSRKAAAKEKIEEASQEESESGKRRTTRSKRNEGLAEAMPPPPAPSTRSGRASSRARAAEAAGATGAPGATGDSEAATDEVAPAFAMPEPRPKRTRAKKKPSEETDSDKDSESLASTIVPAAEAAPAPAAPEPRPKRTRAKKKPTEETDSDQNSESLAGTIVPAAEAAPAPAAPEPRPKRTRAKKKPTEEVELAKQPEPLADEIASPAEKRSKRTQRKAAEKLEQQDTEVPPSVDALISPKEERISQSEQIQSPILLQKTIQKSKLQDQSSKDESKLQNSTSKEDIELQKPTSKEGTKLQKQTSKEDIKLQKQTSKEGTKLQKQTSKEDIKLQKQTSKEDTRLQKQTSKEDTKLQKQNSKEDIKLQKQNSKEDIKLKKSVEQKSKLPKKTNNKTHSKDMKATLVRQNSEELDEVDEPQSSCNALEKTRVLADCEAKSVALDQTVVLPNSLYNHAPVTPKNIRLMEETIIIEKVSKEAAPGDAPKSNDIMDATVVLEPKPVNMIDSNASIMTDDDSFEPAPARPATPPGQAPPKAQPTSAVKEKVQQFEELASRNTRTKTRAMAKKEEKTETETPPDQKSKPVLSADTLNKMNNMIFSGKAPMTSQSASKPRAVLPPAPARPLRPASVSACKSSAAAEQLRRETEDARRKKEALLEAKREEHRRKREEKMAAAAATREAAERERRAALEAAARERRDRQALADVGRAERARGAERKKQELARKMAEMEERRRLEEEARLQRLADEQRRAEARRRQQLEEAEQMRKEEMLMAKEIEKRHKEYMEKQKRHKDDRMVTPSKTTAAGLAGTPGGPGARLPPVYMADGFQFLHSDEEQDEVVMPVPAWSTSKARQRALAAQARLPSRLVDRLFSVRTHSPDLREIFPGVDRRALKRTSSAVWRTPTHAARLPMVHESPI